MILKNIYKIVILFLIFCINGSENNNIVCINQVEMEEFTDNENMKIGVTRLEIEGSETLFNLSKKLWLYNAKCKWISSQQEQILNNFISNSSFPIQMTVENLKYIYSKYCENVHKTMLLHHPLKKIWFVPAIFGFLLNSPMFSYVIISYMPDAYNTLTPIQIEFIQKIDGYSHSSPHLKYSEIAIKMKITYKEVYQIFQTIDKKILYQLKEVFHLYEDGQKCCVIL